MSIANQSLENCIVLATRNKGKIAELEALLAGFGLTVLGLDSFPDIGEIEETGSTFAENAALKARTVAQATGLVALADDSGLAVDALDGAPGVYSARYSPEGDDRSNNRLLIANLQGVDNRAAQFVCVIALARQGKLLGTFRGAIEGRIVDDPRGANGFGYDPHFFHEPFGCTFGEAAPDRKMRISHRAQALDAMIAAATAPGANPLS